ncbi:MAG TPA: hypothetical protein VF155_07965 [Candidatus Dormibacteraeota bacterium]
MHRLRVPLRRRLGAAPLVAALSISIGACGSATPAPPRATVTPTSPTPAALTQFQASTFTVTVPRGWIDRTSDGQAAASINAAAGTLQMLLMAPQTGANVSNEHIDVTTVAQPVPDDQLASYLQSVGQNGATSVTTPQPFNLDGATGLFVTYNLTASASPPAQAPVLMVEDMLVNHGGQTYEIVLNTAQADFPSQTSALQEVLASWHWH